MAGAGQRFVDAGYRIPKPLIPVDGTPMVIRAARSLPAADKWIFVCREEHLRTSDLANVLKREFPNTEIVSTPTLTEGQACTCLLARQLLEPDDYLTIGACDNAMFYDKAKLESLMRDPATDALVWTFKNNPAVLQNPKMYGWVATDADDNASKVSCKIPISDNPIKDHAVIGAFSFRRAGDFVRLADKMIAANRRIKNEFYIDEEMQVAIEAGLRVKAFLVDKYICWGTPQDLEKVETLK